MSDVEKPKQNNLINKYQVDSEEEELISELDFESENSSVYSIDDSETKRE